MPLVFVHGVANRQTPKHRAFVCQRDGLFRKHVLPAGAKVFDPDWGTNAVTFNADLWLPRWRDAEVFAVGSSAAGDDETGLARLAQKDLGTAIDAAFEAGLVAQAEEAVRTGRPEEALGGEELEDFTAAVRYLEDRADRYAFDSNATDAAFLRTLAGELYPPTPGATLPPEAYSSVRDKLRWVGEGVRTGVKTLVGGGRNVVSTSALLLTRSALSESAALFLGDIFVYLRWREMDGAGGTFNRIMRPIIDDLGNAMKLRTELDPLVVVGHSLGGVILYDLLTDQRALTAVEGKAGMPLVVDHWVTVGSQPGLFADMGLYRPQPGAAKLPRPNCVREWLNVYDYTDLFSFACKEVFDNVEDFTLNNLTGSFSAHSAYFRRPQFYKRLRERTRRVEGGAAS